MSTHIPRGRTDGPSPPAGPAGPAGAGPGRGWQGPWHNAAGTHPRGPAGIRPPITSQRPEPEDEPEGD